MDRRDEMREFGGLVPPDSSFDSKTMTLTVTLEDDEGEEREFEIPCCWEVCPTCRGNGKHVNPSIDAHGISAEEFDCDPEFEESYFSGAYDVTCYECGGRRVVPDIDRQRADAEAVRLYDEWVQSECEYRAECAAERRAENWYA